MTTTRRSIEDVGRHGSLGRLRVWLGQFGTASMSELLVASENPQTKEIWSSEY